MFGNGIEDAAERSRPQRIVIRHRDVVLMRILRREAEVRVTTYP